MSTSSLSFFIFFFLGVSFCTPFNVSLLNLVTLHPNTCLPSYPNAGITAIQLEVEEIEVEPLLPCDLYHSPRTLSKLNCSFYKTHFPAIPDAYARCPRRTYVQCALVRPFEMVSISRKHYFNLQKGKGKPFPTVLTSFLKFVGF